MVDPNRDDRVLFKRFANRSHAMGAHGGQLFVTAKGVTFRPHWFDRWFVKAPTVVMPWSEISAVEVMPREKEDRWQGGMRRRLRISRRDGTDERFVVNRVDWVADRVRELQQTVATGL